MNSEGMPSSTITPVASLTLQKQFKPMTIKFSRLNKINVRDNQILIHNKGYALNSGNSTSVLRINHANAEKCLVEGNQESGKNNAHTLKLVVLNKIDQGINKGIVLNNNNGISSCFSKLNYPNVKNSQLEGNLKNEKNKVPVFVNKRDQNSVQSHLKLVRISPKPTNTILVSVSASFEKLLGRKNVNILVSALKMVPDEKLRLQALNVLASTNKLISHSSTQTEFPQNNICSVSDIAREIGRKKREEKLMRKRKIKIPFVTDNTDIIPKRSRTSYYKKCDNSATRPDFQENYEHSNSSEATPSEATPSKATPSEATPSEATPSEATPSETTPTTSSAIKNMKMSMVFNNFSSNQTSTMHISDKTKNVENLPQPNRSVFFRFLEDLRICLNADSKGLLPIHNAVHFDDEQMLRKQIIALKLLNENINIVDTDGKTALHWAILSNASEECIDVLLNGGANPLLVDSDSNSVLHYCAMEKDSFYMKKIIDHLIRNASILLETPFCKGIANLLKLDAYGLVTWNCMNSQMRVLTMAYMCTNELGFTVLMCAAMKGNKKNIESLLESCTNICDSSTTVPNINTWVLSIINKQAGNCGTTALHFAFNKGKAEMEKDNAPLINVNYAECIKILLENGANHEAPNQSGYSISDVLLDVPSIENINVLADYLSQNMIKAEDFLSHDEDDDNEEDFSD